MKTTKQVLCVLLSLLLSLALVLPAVAADEVSYDPIITQQPKPKKVRVGLDFTLNVTAKLPQAGGALSYQWYQNDEAIAGATQDSYQASSKGFPIAGKGFMVTGSEYVWFSVVVTNTYQDATGETQTASVTCETYVSAFGGLWELLSLTFAAVFNAPDSDRFFAEMGLPFAFGAAIIVGYWEMIFGI
jgi:hypothetical protein